MNSLRNTSSQPLLIQRKDSSVFHLMPGRAVALDDDEIESSQVSTLLARDLVKVVPMASTTTTASRRPAAIAPTRTRPVEVAAKDKDA